uniref:Uncharacterized protein n=1 Tax=Salix viminalis TaxID=40686 RepID=A0A6N2LQE5_SALVM
MATVLPIQTNRIRQIQLRHTQDKSLTSFTRKNPRKRLGKTHPESSRQTSFSFLFHNSYNILFLSKHIAIVLNYQRLQKRKGNYKISVFSSLLIRGVDFESFWIKRWKVDLQNRQMCRQNAHLTRTTMAMMLVISNAIFASN